MPAISIAIGLYAGAGGAEPGPQRQKGEVAAGVTVSISSRSKSFAQSEPVILAIRAKNHTRDRLLVTHLNNLSGMMALFVYDAKGNPVPRTRFFSQVADGEVDASGKPNVWEPGGRISGTLAVGLMYDLSLPGDYRIVASLPFWKHEDTAKLHEARSNELRIHVDKAVVDNTVRFINP